MFVCVLQTLEVVFVRWSHSREISQPKMWCILGFCSFSVSSGATANSTAFLYWPVVSYFVGNTLSVVKASSKLRQVDLQYTYIHTTLRTTQVIPTPSNMYLRDKVTKGKNKHVLKPKLDEDYSSLQINTSFIVIMCI